MCVVFASRKLVRFLLELFSDFYPTVEKNKSVSAVTCDESDIEESEGLSHDDDNGKDECNVLN